MSYGDRSLTPGCRYCSQKAHRKNSKDMDKNIERIVSVAYEGDFVKLVLIIGKLGYCEQVYKPFNKFSFREQRFRRYSSIVHFLTTKGLIECAAKFEALTPTQLFETYLDISVAEVCGRWSLGNPSDLPSDLIASIKSYVMGGDLESKKAIDMYRHNLKRGLPTQ